MRKLIFNPPWQGPPLEFDVEFDMQLFLLDLRTITSQGYYLIFQKVKNNVQLIATGDKSVLSKPGLIGLSKFQISETEKALMPALVEISPDIESYSLDVPGVFYNNSNEVIHGTKIWSWKVNTKEPIVIVWDHDLGDLFVDNMTQELYGTTSLYKIVEGVYFYYIT